MHMLAVSTRRRTRRNFTPEEHDEQVALIQWSEYALPAHPELALLYAIPNGGKRSRAVAAKLKAEGVKAGVLDLCLPVPRGTFHGLYIEMKRRHGGVLSADQTYWRDQLSAQGYQTYVCKGWESARDAIIQYLALPDCRRVAA